ncbi:hypothetical protein DEFDS_P023 (plasmid) [Deferribacter desulfuricans SSM1]|uniref:Uncharacterized protein n=1 Tax=Deferribacter desulfuricans (strain DSM 14783 / JCM 11476 / NBRC 101012 / SSM1) TaxID=639282 RepID=D3PEK9_DEFDS|nr:hypothetical protein [Deferribacter desulfuricans]BAI81651.1 hypothetical protein DEFDS_P023 [Deferribacter desulfuricans SSM1]
MVSGFNNRDYALFQEKDLDNIIDLFDWFRPEDVIFLYVYYSGIVGLSIGVYVTFKFDPFFLFGKNGIIGEIPGGWYALFLLLGIPFLYFNIITRIRKKYTKGYLGRKLFRLTKSKIGKIYSPFEKYRFDDL